MEIENISENLEVQNQEVQEAKERQIKEYLMARQKNSENLDKRFILYDGEKKE